MEPALRAAPVHAREQNLTAEPRFSAWRMKAGALVNTTPHCWQVIATGTSFPL